MNQSNLLENLQSKIPDFSQIDYTGVLCDMSEDKDFQQSFAKKDPNIFVNVTFDEHDSNDAMNENFIEKYAETAMNPNKQQEHSKNKDFSESNMSTFHHVIKGTEPFDIKKKIKKSYVATLINSTPFMTFISIVILANTVCICIQTYDNIYNKNPIIFQIIDSLCVIIFTIELILRFYSDPKEFWFSGWNIFDLIIVIFSYVSSTLTFLTSFRVLRIFRVLKAFRILKGLKSVKYLSRMFIALVKASKDIGLVLLLIIMFLLCGSFIALNLFSSFSDFWFGSFFRTLWTLVIFLTADGWLDPYNDLVDAGRRYPAMIFIFVFIWIGAWILVNTLVGVSVNSINSANKEANEQNNEMKKIKKNENKKIDESTEIKKLSPPPFNADRSWETQLPLEVPKLDHINSDALVRLYLTLSLINSNIDEMDNLIGKYQETVTEVISNQDSLQRNDQ